MIYDEKYDIPIFEDEDILDAVDYSEKLKNALVTKFDKDNNTINTINNNIDGISDMVISINRTKADANSVYTKKESDNKYANAIKQELTKAKEAQINSTGANLQNVEFFGESVQETREGYNKLKYPYASLFTDTIFTDVGDGTIKLNGTLENNTSKYFVKNYFLKAGTYTIVTGLGKDVNLPNTSYFLVKKSTESSFLVKGARKDTEFTLDVDSNIDISVIYVAGAYNNVLLKPMLILGTEEKPYEQYGAMPSIDYPSSVNSIKNIDYKITGKNAIYDTFSKTNGFITYKVAKENVTQNMLFSGIIDSNVKATVYFSVDDKIVSAGEINIIENTKFSKVINVTIEILGLVKNSQNIFLQIYNNQVDFSNFNDKEIMLEHGTVLTDYEPYKEIKTTIALPENVELCSVPNGTQDYIDSTGVIHKNILKIALGTQNWSIYQSEANADRYYCFTSDVDSLIKEYPTQNTYNFCNIAQSVEMLLTSTAVDKDSFCIGYQGAARLRFMLKKDVIDAQEGDTLSAKLNNLFISKNAYILAENIEETTQNLAETEKTKLQNIETFEGVNNITSNAPISAVYNTDTKSYIDSKFNTLAQQILSIAGGN